MNITSVSSNPANYSNAVEKSTKTETAGSIAQSAPSIFTSSASSQGSTSSFCAMA